MQFYVLLSHSSSCSSSTAINVLNFPYVPFLCFFVCNPWSLTRVIHLPIDGTYQLEHGSLISVYTTKQFCLPQCPSVDKSFLGRDIDSRDLLSFIANC